MKFDDADVVIIGAGAGGGSSAWALANHGINVLVLEAGPAYNPLSDYRLHSPDWELHSFPDKQEEKLRYRFGEMQRLENEYNHLRSWNHIHGFYNTTQRRHGFKYHHVQGVGGSTLHFTGEAHRLNPNTMKLRSDYGVASDWPLTYEELEPYYEVAENIIGVAGKGGNDGRPRRSAFPLPHHAPGHVSQKIIRGTQDLGITWSPNSLAVLSRSYDDRPACNYCSGCNRGCPRTDKGSVDVTFIRKALATNHCRIEANTRVLQLRAGEHDLIHSIEFLDSNGRTQSVKSRVVIVACGAIETPRLLLLSQNNHAPEGLANESGLVGRNLMESVGWVCTGLSNEPLGSYRGLPTDIICWDYNNPDSIPGATGGCRFSPATAEANLLGPVKYAQRVVSGWGSQHKQAMRRDFGNAIAIGSMGESLPNDLSYVDLDHDHKDSNNLPLARIHSYVADNDIKLLDFMKTKSREILNAISIKEVIEEYGTYDYFSSTHIFGTARMGDSPETSVVDKYCKSHRWENLYIVDASVFPSSGGGEAPSLTIQALAIRAAEHIRNSLINKEF